MTTSLIAIESHDSRTVEETKSGLKMTRKYTVVASSYTDIDGPLALTAFGIPLEGQAYDTGVTNFPMALCLNRRAIPKGPGIYEVECEFSTPDPSGQGQNTQASIASPFLEIPEIKIGTWEHEEPCLATDPSEPNPVAFLNSAGEIYDPSPSRTIHFPTLEISLNVVTDAPLAALSVLYSGTVNSDRFWGAPAGQVRCEGIEVTRMLRTLPSQLMVIYLRATYKFKFKYPDWDLRLLDVGTFYKISMNPAKPRQPFIDDHGHPYVGLLDGSGGKNPDGDPPVYLPAKRIYRRLPFSVLGLPGGFI